MADPAPARRGAGDAAQSTDIAGASSRRVIDADTAALIAALGQADHDVRFEWGADGLAAVAAGVATVVIVDVLRFTTAVSVAVGRGAAVLPYLWAAGDAAAAYARRHGAELAGWREQGGWSLSPTDLLALPVGARLVLPSPNGSALAFGATDEAPDAVVLAGCLRNARAVGVVAATRPGPVAVVAAGERWHGDLGPVRPAVEDLVGAGAVLHHVLAARPGDGRASPEARAATVAFAAAGDDLPAWLAATASGRALAARGWADDVATAADLDAEDVVPVLRGAEFVAVTPGDAGHLR